MKKLKNGIRPRRLKMDFNKYMCNRFAERRITMSNEQQDRAVFVSFCIEQYAKAKGMGTEEVVKLFEQYGIVEHFCEFYDVLHTQGHHWLIEEIDEMINDRKK